jgi:hypothetical protein
LPGSKNYFPEDRPDLGDVRLAVLAEHGAVGVDHDGGVVEDALELLLEEGHDEHDLVGIKSRAHGASHSCSFVW